MEKSVENKVIVVTGGAGGMGLEMVKNFLEKGAKTVIILDFNEEVGAKVIKELTSKYGEERAVFFKCDVTSDLETIFEKIINEYKTVDVLINNAGILKETDIRKTFEVNTLAVMEWTFKFYDYMRKDRSGKGGTIINVSSIYGFRIIPTVPVYNASKFAVWGFSKSIGHEYNYNKTGVRVIALCPGLTHTNLTDNPNTREPGLMEDLFVELNATEWQGVEAMGKGTIEVFEQADSGTAWLVEGSRPAVMI